MITKLIKMNNIVYTTAVSKETVEAYERYQNAKEKYPNGDIKLNAYWNQFCNACDKENKAPLSVAKTLSQ